MPKSAQHQQDYQSLRDQLKLKTFQLRQNLANKHEHITPTVLSKALDIEKIRQKSAHLLSASALAGAFLLAPVTSIKALPPATEIMEKVRQDHSSFAPTISPQKLLLESLNQILPNKPRTLTREEEKELEQIFGQILGVPAKATLEGEHLNTTYGYIGAEQSLLRYPGDTVGEQMKIAEPEYVTAVAKEGLAPHVGAWGYFAKSKKELTPELVETEKWYAVVQTLYLPDWNTRTKYLKEWYKYRKVLIVNTLNGNSVVAAIADSGPAAFTGKQFGGSPEVMTYLGGPRYKKGAVVVFFVDDPENKVPLGPVEYNKIDLPEWAFHQV